MSPTLRSAVLAATLIALAAAASCTHRRVRTAPFRERPSSVEAGKLIGPFNGQVVDATTGSPVAGALVYATWTFQTGYGLTNPAGFHEEVTSTDANGRYEIPSLAEVESDPKEHPAVTRWRDSGGSVRLTDFHLVVYKRGFVGYRSDRRFADLGPRRDFTQHRNEIRLERWRADFSHARHLRYVGGGPALAALTSWEAEEAAAELSGQDGAGPRIATDLFEGRRQRLVAAQLVTQEDIEDVTGYDGSFETGPLGDEPDTRAYSSQHFQAAGLPQAYDLAVRLWTVGPGPAQKRYAKLLDDLPGVEERDEISDRSLRAEEQGFYGIAYLDARRGIVVLVTCGKALCDGMDDLVTLGEKSHERLENIAPPGGLRPEDSQ